jgi:LysR family glycine cleavage system transcriptional activator
MYDAPSDLVAQELFRDEFMAVCSPALLPDGKPLKQLGYLKEYTAIHCYWAPSDRHAPTWERWLNAARSIDPDAPLLNEMRQLSFREELHAIEAALAGQGIAISSDVLVGNEVDAGTMTKVATPTIPGYGYYVVHPPNSPRQLVIDAFREWARSVR